VIDIKMNCDTAKTLVAMACITFLEGIALIKEVDGYLFMPVIAILSGLAGYSLKTVRNK
jgi:hypothetical protein